MDTMWRMYTTQGRSPLPRQFAQSSISLVGKILEAKMGLCTAATSPTLSLCVDPRTGSAAAAAMVRAQFVSLSRGGLGGHHLVGRLSPSLVFFGGNMERASISTGKITAGGEVGVVSGSKNQGREILVQHLLLKEDQLQLLIQLHRRIIEEGLDLSDAAEEHSICPSKAEGGMIGWIKLGQTDPAFEEAAFTAPMNKLVRVTTKHGLHLLQVLNERKSQFLVQIQVEEFHGRMQAPNFLDDAQLIDVREPDEISTAAIKGFQAYPLSQFGQWAPNIADDLDPEKETYVLAANWLQSQGFKRLYNVSGGIHAYSKNVDSTIPTY